MILRRWGAWMLVLLLAAPIATARAQQRLLIDPARSHFGFEIRTRFGQLIEGEFPRFDGVVIELPDGRHQVRLRMYTADVVIPGKERYTEWMRGHEFFDAEHYPVVEFDSLPYSLSPQVGGDVVGNLTIRGITHLETLSMEPAECARAGYDCDVTSSGTILRGRYGMDSWGFVLGDKVTFRLSARLAEAHTP